MWTADGALIKNLRNFSYDKEILKGAVAKSYMTNGLLIYMTKYSRISLYIRKPFLIYDFPTAPYEFPYI